jgi:hypothetical protein
MRLRLFTTALLALQLCQVAHADDILYTIVGTNGYSQNVDITYLSESGFLDFSSEHLIPTTTSDLTWKGMDLGLVTSIVFYNSDLMELYAKPGFAVSYGGPYSGYPTYSLNTFGIQELGYASLTITDLGSSATPEPCSLLLLCTGLLSFVGLAALRCKRRAITLSRI